MGATGGLGVTFNIGDGDMDSSPSYTPIANVKSFNGVDSSLVMDDITAHDSTGGYREKLPSGILEMANIELVLAFDISEATHDNASGGLVHAHLNETLLAYQIIFPDTGTTTWTFDAYARRVRWESPIGGSLAATVELEITGQPTLT